MSAGFTTAITRSIAGASIRPRGTLRARISRRVEPSREARPSDGRKSACVQLTAPTAIARYLGEYFRSSFLFSLLIFRRSRFAQKKMTC